MKSPMHEQNFLLCTEEQAMLLRSDRMDELDVENISVELNTESSESPNAYYRFESTSQSWASQEYRKHKRPFSQVLRVSTGRQAALNPPFDGMPG